MGLRNAEGKGPLNWIVSLASGASHRTVLPASTTQYVNLMVAEDAGVRKMALQNTHSKTQI